MSGACQGNFLRGICAGNVQEELSGVEKCQDRHTGLQVLTVIISTTMVNSVIN